MATGTDSFMGKAMPILGNTTLTGETAADDILTITAATSQSGDYFVCENSTGTEHFVISSSGLVTMTSMSVSGTITKTVSSSAANGLVISVTSTGAMAAGYTVGANANAILVQPSSKAIMNAVVMYDSVGASASSQVNDANSFLAVNGSKAPLYFLQMWGSAMGLGAAADCDFLDVGLTSNTAATKAAWAGIKCLFGSKMYYILAIPDTNLT